MPYDVRSRTDPIRNFKFQVQIIHPTLQQAVGNMGFTNVAGLNMTTEAIPYREGGWNTNPHKLPGQTDFGPITLIQGVMYTQPGMWDLAKNIFAVQWGAGTLAADTQFRFTTVIRVLDHPITINPGAGGTIGSPTPDGARLAFVAYNCWVGSVAYNDLDAMGNAVLISQMTMHHEGFDVLFGQDAIAA
jgi:phage tail-like protein